MKRGPGRARDLPGASNNISRLVVDFEVKNVRDLEVRTIDQDQIATDDDVRIILRRRREHHFEFMWARPHLAPEVRRQNSANH